MSLKIIHKKTGMRRVSLQSGIFCGFVFLCVVVFPQQTSAYSISDLAKDFLNRISPVYEEPKKFNPLDQIPDGGTLLLRPRAEKLLFEQDIYAIKKDGTIYMSLSDFINILNLAIDYDEDSFSGSGWFLREDWNIQFSMREGKVISRGEEFPIRESAVFQQDGLYFVKTDSLAQWFGLDLTVDPEQQILDVVSPFPFPSIAKAKRDKKFRGRREREYRNAKLPRLEYEPSLFDINTADISLGNRIQKDAYGNITDSETANIYLQGEVLKHNTLIYALGDDRDGLRNVKVTFSKKSENTDLLGRLHARDYSFGDVDEVKIPLVSNADNNLGFRISNTTVANANFATTDIKGDIFPGWDVQLFRDGILVDSLTVDLTGEYEFEDIQLFLGENNFELFFFGPQGEIRSKNFTVPVSQTMLSSQNNTYDMSVTFEDTQTYKDTTTSDKDTNSVNFSAKYNRMISENHLGYLGFRTQQLDGERKFYISGGTVSTLGKTLVNLNFAADEEGNAVAEAIARRNISGWDTSLRTRLNTGQYTYNETEDVNTAEVALNSRRLINFGGFKTNLMFDGLYSQTKSGEKYKSFNLQFANRIYGASLSNGLRYEDDSSEDDSELEHVLSIRKNFGKLFLNLATTYTLMPERQLNTVLAQTNYRFNSRFSADLTYNRQFISDIDTLRFNANYIHDKFRLSPYIQYSSTDEIVGGVNLNFSLYDDPNSPWPNMTNQRLTGYGGASAFVFHDKDGNNIFNDGDEPIEGARVSSLVTKRRDTTDANGYMTIPNLPVGKATDIAISEGDLPDPFMIAAEGKSVYPAAGTFFDMEFPVHMSGEVDGAVYYYNDEDKDEDLDDGEEREKLPVSYVDLALIPLHKTATDPVSTKSESDGYYVAYMIPPGDYLLMTQEKFQYGNTPPQKVTIGYDGTIIRDMGIEMIRDAAYVPYEVSYGEDDKVALLPDAAKTYKRVLKVKKSGQSELSKTLFGFFNKQGAESFEGLTKLTTMENDNGVYDLYIAADNARQDDESYLHNRCQTMKETLMECSIIINAPLY